jgi:hypothetical protein
MADLDLLYRLFEQPDHQLARRARIKRDLRLANHGNASRAER